MVLCIITSEGLQGHFTSHKEGRAMEYKDPWRTYEESDDDIKKK